MKHSRKKLKTGRQRRKRKSFISKFYFPILGVVLFSGAAVYAFFYFSPQFEIKELKVSGIESTSEEELSRAIKDKFTISYSFFGKTGTIENIFLPAGKGIDEVLKDFPQIDSINVSKNFAKGSLLIDVKEKVPFVTWTEKFDNNNCYLFDARGSFIKNCESENNSLISVFEESRVCGKNEEIRKTVINSIEKIINNSRELGLSFSGFSLYSDDKLSLNLNQNCQIIFNPASDLDWQLEKLNIVLTQDKYISNLEKYEYIDLRFGNQAIIK
jgi:cell division septal protein FtsQ